MNRMKSLDFFGRAAERGEPEGHFAPGPRGLKGLIIGELTFGLKEML